MDSLSHSQIIEKTAGYVRTQLSADTAGHDWWHIQRVWTAAIYLAHQEHADLYIVELAALLHDIADWKFHNGDENAGPRVARTWLESCAVETEVLEHVCAIIQHLSFKGAGVPSQISTLEGRVVQDADRLDAIGAIGVARAFAYGGSRGRPLYDPGRAPVLHTSFEQYRVSQADTINHFYEKLLLLKERMNTPTARRVAEQRHAFLQLFLERFFQEWDGKDLAVQDLL